MEVLSWIWWVVTSLFGVVWSIVWFLLGGWVATLAQVVIVLGVIFSYKYGWRRAPIELAQRGRALGRFIWGWMRAREFTEPPVAPRRAPVRSPYDRRTREAGDVNASTLLSVLAIVGLGLVALTP